MAADFDDTTEDFFDNLVNSDDDADDDRPSLPSAAEAEASAGDLAALTLTDQSDAKPDNHPAPAPLTEHHPAPPNPQLALKEEALLEPEPAVAPPPEAAADQPAVPPPGAAADVPAAAPEAVSTGSDKGVHAAAPSLKQAHWNDFGGASTGAPGADPFGDLPPASPPERDTNSANSQFDSATGAAGYATDHSTNAQLESADPRYLESLYPGWKYDDTTQQWYQVDTLTDQHVTTEVTSAVASDGIQQQQQLSALYLQNDSHAAAGLEPTEVTPQPKPVTQADDQPMPAPHKEEEEEEHEPTLAHPQETKSEVQETHASADEAAMAPDSGSPGSHKGIHTAIKQVQWNDFGSSTSAGGADPFGDLLPEGAEDDLFGATVPGDQGMQASVVGTNNVSTTDHSFSAGVDNKAAIGAGLTDYSFYGGMDNDAISHFDSTASAAGYGDQSTNAQLDSTDPKYLETLYPGWKYDAATQQWYQVDTPSAQSYVADNTGAVAVLGSGVQQQQQFNASYLQNSLHSALETIAEESSANAATWGAAPVEYPPNMLFYAEYPGWYFDTNTQQWQSLESYQQSVAQAATTPAASDGFAGAGHSLAPCTQDSYASSYGQQSQWQPDSLGNTMQPDVSGGNSLLGSSYSSNQQAENQIGQQANAESLQSSVNYKPHIDTFAIRLVMRGSNLLQGTRVGTRVLSILQTAMDFAQQQLIGTNGPSQQFGFSPHEQRSSAGRPPHAV
uniref:Uncharacterized protein n=1 Tax=Setaria italica TaxID=4555 RepID=A0A0Q3PSX8_SETIT